MKKQLTKKMVITAFAVSAIFMSNIFAQENQVNQTVCNLKAIQNLIQGIKSNNLGLKRSAIYYAGKYKIEEAVEVIIEELKSINDPQTRCLTALSLYKIGNKNGMRVVNELAGNDPDAKVRRIAAAIYETYSLETAQAEHFAIVK